MQRITTAVFRIVPAAALLVAGGCDADEGPDLAPSHLSLLGAETFPEGIAAHPPSESLFVGGLGSGDIQRIDADGATVFKAAHEDGLLNVIGMAVDADHDRLWVCSSSFFDPTVAPSVLVFDIPSGDRIAAFDPPEDGVPHFFNDVAMDAAGNAYVTDSLAPVVYRVDSDLQKMTELASDPRFVLDPAGFNLNGIAVTPDDAHAIVSLPSLTGTGGKLFRVALTDGAVHEFDLPDSYGGVDGLAAIGSHTMVGAGGVPGLTTFAFDDAFESVELRGVDAYDEALDLPTTVAVLQDRLWVVNSQLDHFVPLFDAFGTPPDPFEVVGIPLAGLE